MSCHLHHSLLTKTVNIATPHKIKNSFYYFFKLILNKQQPQNNKQLHQLATEILKNTQKNTLLGKMEIEKKFLLKEKEKIYPSDFDLDKIKKEIKEYGRPIVQHYIPKELILDVIDMLDIKINFKPNELRIRKIKDDHFLTIKSNGSKKREEFEIPIQKETFKELRKLKEKTVEKIRLMKMQNERPIFIDYYPKYSLIIAEIEFKTENEADSFQTHMRDITGETRYKNRQLAY